MEQKKGWFDITLSEGLLDAVDIFIRGATPELQDTVRNNIDKFPSWLRTKMGSRVAFMVAQFVERMGGHSRSKNLKRVFELLSDATEVVARELSQQSTSRTPTTSAEQDYISKARNDIYSSDNPEEKTELWRRRIESFKQLQREVELPQASQPRRQTRINWNKVKQVATETANSGWKALQDFNISCNDFADKIQQARQQAREDRRRRRWGK